MIKYTLTVSGSQDHMKIFYRDINMKSYRYTPVFNNDLDYILKDYVDGSKEVCDDNLKKLCEYHLNNYKDRNNVGAFDPWFGNCYLYRPKILKSDVEMFVLIFEKRSEANFTADLENNLKHFYKKLKIDLESDEK